MGSKITEKYYRREEKLLRKIRSFEKPRVQEIGIQLFTTQAEKFLNADW